MKRQLSIRPEAKDDITRAFKEYKRHNEGLGRSFLAELEKTLEAIETRPYSFPRIHGEKRRALLSRFPLAVFFRLPADEIVILAIFHQASDPRRWETLQ